jgi:hypothetical protein
MTDDTLSPDERAALDSLAREIPPPPGLEDRVVTDLAGRGAFTRRQPRPFARHIAAAVLLFAAGFASARLPWRAAESSLPQFLLLLYGGETTSAAELAARVAEYAAWGRVEADAGRLVAAEKLEDARLLLGPASVVGTGAHPSGFFLIRADSLDAAREAAATNPHLRHGGAIVVRPIDRRR